VAPLLKKFVCLHIDIDRDTWTAGLYHVNGIPRVLILDPSGTVLSDLVGYRKKQELMPLLSAVPGDFSPVAAVIARLKEDSDDFPAWMGMAEFYAKLGASDASTKYLKDALKTTEGKGHNRSRENALNKLGLQSLKMKRAKDARKAFQQCLAEFGADGSQCDFAMLGLITALASERKFDEAEKLLAELRGRFPDSPVVDRAVKNIEEARAAR
jgi:thioredoxin-like negative regulator of GroEL